VLTDLHPGVAVEHVVAATGWRLVVADDVRELDPPSDEELRTLRKVSARG
jgi:glutaconate CoA-transferase, subunit B